MNDDKKQKAIFIDRDGTLVEEVDFLSRVEDLRLFSFTGEAVRLFKENNFLVIVVTNQSGIGRKIFAESAMHEIHENIQTELGNQLDGFYFCPHLPGDNCRCRKPNLGMIETARANFAIEMNESWMIGDKAIDIETGRNANIKTALVLTGYGQNDVNKLKSKPDVIAENLLDAARQIVRS